MFKPNTYLQLLQTIPSIPKPILKSVVDCIFIKQTVKDFYISKTLSIATSGFGKINISSSILYNYINSDLNVDKNKLDKSLIGFLF